jgi:hypothetical protein
MDNDAYPDTDSEDEYAQDCGKCNHGAIMWGPK